MCNGNTSNCYAGTHITVREVYGIFDITILKEITNLLHSHNCTVLLRFLCGCSKMRSYQNALMTCNCMVGKVCYILFHLAAVQRLNQRILVNQKVTGKVQKYNTVFHLIKSLFVDHLLCGIQKRYMYSDIIALAVNLI